MFEKGKIKSFLEDIVNFVSLAFGLSYYLILARLFKNYPMF